MTVKRLWAPWRMAYIMQPKPVGCIFCDKPKERGRDRENLILHRGNRCFVIMNLYPYNNGHVMVVPYRHVTQLSDLEDPERDEMMSLLSSTVDIIGRVLKMHGANIGMNLGRVAGAGIDDHLHFHVVPRWDGDTNFMPVTGDTKVISQSLRGTWELLRPHFNPGRPPCP